MAPGELKAALRIVWLTLSAVALFVLVAPWVLSAAQIAAAVPKCERKTLDGRECFLCGMTTAFLRISRGRLGEAEAANQGSVPLYAGLVMNEGILMLSLLKPRPSTGC